MIKNLTKLGCHLVCYTYYLKIAHYLPDLIFWELTSLCRNRSNDQSAHLFEILSRFGVPMAGGSLRPFSLVTHRHPAAASSEARLEVPSAMAEAIVTSVTLTTALEGSTDVPLLPWPPTIIAHKMGPQPVPCISCPALCFLLSPQVSSAPLGR